MTTIDGVYSLGSELLQSETPEVFEHHICGKEGGSTSAGLTSTTNRHAKAEH
jgi:hypothetical protein